MTSTQKDLLRFGMRKIKSLYRRFIPLKTIPLEPSYHRFSYSQEGEDMVLATIFGGKTNGFYVDVGAHHPQRFSNTYHFYLNGWNGINIDAMPGSMKIFDKLRPKDINVEAAIADEQKDLTFYIFNEPALNSFDKELSEKRNSDVYRIVQEQKLSTKTLKEILAYYLPYGKKIDFLSVDVEGLDLAVLKSNDWQLYRPDYILVECLEVNICEIEKNDVYKFLLNHNYLACAKTINTVIFGNRLFRES